MRHFDENGNFIEKLPEEEREEQSSSEEISVNYIYRKNPQKKD